MELDETDRLGVFALLMELDGIPRTEFAASVQCLSRGIGALLETRHVRLLLAQRDPSLSLDDPLYGWRVCRILESDPDPPFVRRLERLARTEEYVVDSSSIALAERAGTTHRVLHHGHSPSSEYWDDGPVSRVLAEAGVHDVLQGAHTIDTSRELIISASRVGDTPAFSARDRAMMLALVSGLGRHAWRIAAAHGLLADAMLTSREREALAWVLRGLAEAEIAEQMGISVRTVHGHIMSLYRKFWVHSRPELTALWLQ